MGYFTFLCIFFLYLFFPGRVREITLFWLPCGATLSVVPLGSLGFRRAPGSVLLQACSPAPLLDDLPSATSNSIFRPSAHVPYRLLITYVSVRLHTHITLSFPIVCHCLLTSSFLSVLPYSDSTALRVTCTHATCAPAHRTRDPHPAPPQSEHPDPPPPSPPPRCPVGPCRHLLAPRSSRTTLPNLAMSQSRPRSTT